jgi:adenine-specific DNA-methyltransferase
MAAINDLIRQITDPDLRDRIQKEVNKLNKQKKFGLVFEEHLPECTPLYDIPVRRGVKASLKTGDVSDFYQVLKVEDGKALCIKRGETEAVEFLADDLVTIAEFGEPIYPYLKPIDTVNNAPDSDLWHTLIEADNYHALQLLEYLYAGKVDCIYIDPPYNTGARDWKYNNDYVDSGDTYRHSKWLSMMQRRLQIAKRLLSKDGVMVIAIDDYEEAHLIMLLEDIYPDYDISPVVVNHHPQGGAADNISRTHEYAIFVTPKGKKVVHGKRQKTWKRIGR